MSAPIPCPACGERAYLLLSDGARKCWRCGNVWEPEGALPRPGGLSGGGRSAGGRPGPPPAIAPQPSLPAPRGELGSRAVALDPSGPGLVRRVRPGRGGWESVAVNFADPVQVAETALSMGARQLWLGPQAGVHLGLPPAFVVPFEQRGLPVHLAHVPSAWIARLAGAGWKASVPGWNPWVELERDGARLDVVLSHWGDNPFGQARAAGELLDGLELFARGVGLRYHRSPGVTGLSLMRAVHNGPGGIPLEPGPHLPPPALEPSDSQAGGSWIAAELPADGWLHCWDVNGMFLAACSSAELGFGAPRLVKFPPQPLAADFQPEPGYYRARAALASTASPFKVDGKAHWYTAPALRLLVELRANVTVSEAWVYPEGHRWLEPWYCRLRDARAAYLERGEPGAALALAAVKAAYTRALGRLAGRWLAAGDSTFRPDWRDVVIDRARANLYRHIARAEARSGIHVLAVDADALVYRSSFADPAQAAAELGLDVHPTQLGKLKHRWRLSAAEARQAAQDAPGRRRGPAAGLRRLRALLAAGEASL